MAYLELEKSGNIINTYSLIVFADWTTSQGCKIKDFGLMELE
jgi:hypothetical protein